MRDNLTYQEKVREELIGGEAVMMAPSPLWNHVGEGTAAHRPRDLRRSFVIS